MKQHHKPFPRTIVTEQHPKMVRKPITDKKKNDDVAQHRAQSTKQRRAKNRLRLCDRAQSDDCWRCGKKRGKKHPSHKTSQARELVYNTRLHKQNRNQNTQRNYAGILEKKTTTALGHGEGIRDHILKCIMVYLWYAIN